MLGLTSLLTVAGTAALTLASPTKRDTYSGDGAKTPAFPVNMVGSLIVNVRV